MLTTDSSCLSQQQTLEWPTEILHLEAVSGPFDFQTVTPRAAQASGPEKASTVEGCPACLG